MISENFIWLAAAIGLSGSIVYVISTLKGEAKPNRVTWFLWALIPFIASAAQLKEGVGLQVLFSFIVGFGPLLVLVSSFFNKESFWKISNLDIICGLISVVAIVLWIITDSGVTAILFAILADFLAGVPTIIKAYRFPETENGQAFGIFIISAVLSSLAIDNWVFAEYSFVLYILFMNVLLFFLIQFKLGLKIKNKFA